SNSPTASGPTPGRPGSGRRAAWTPRTSQAGPSSPARAVARPRASPPGGSQPGSGPQTGQGTNPGRGLSGAVLQLSSAGSGPRTRPQGGASSLGSGRPAGFPIAWVAAAGAGQGESTPQPRPITNPVTTRARGSSPCSSRQPVATIRSDART